MSVSLVIQSALFGLAWLIAARFARTGFREHLEQVLLHALAAAAMMVAIVLKWDSPLALLLQSFLVLGPIGLIVSLQRGIQVAVNRGDIDHALAISRRRYALFPFRMYYRQLKLFEGLAEIRDRAHLEGRRPGEVMNEVGRRPGLEPLQEYAVIADFTQKAAARDWSGIVAVFERGMRLPAGLYEAAVAILAVRAYCELGALEPALNALHRLEAHPGWRTIRGQMHVAWLAALATGGRRKAVDEMLEHQLRALPLPVALGWRARAAWAAGALGEAKALLKPLLEQDLPDPLKTSIEERMQQMSTPPPQMTGAVEGALDRLEQLTRADRLFFQGAGRPVGSRPIVAALLTVMLAMFTATYILSDWSTSLSQLALGGLMVAAEPWRLITSLFMSDGWMALLLNGLVLMALGSVVEGIYRRGWTLLMFLVSGLAANVVGAWITPQEWLMGVSGALLGWFGAMLAVSIRAGSLIPEPWRASLRWRGALILGSVVVVGLLTKQFSAVAWLVGLGVGLSMGLVLPLPGLDAVVRLRRPQWRPGKP